MNLLTNLYEIQGSQEWLSWRSKHIGASDAAAILGICPYKTPYQLWQEKMGMYEPDMNEAMRRGSENEPIARKKFCELTGFNMTPCVREHKTIPYMAASLDGLSDCGSYILEIKCNGQKNHLLTKQGNIPPHHYAQVQHQMEVFKVNRVYYFSYVEDDPFIQTVERDQKFIDKLLIAEREFWKCIEDFTPPTMCGRDYTFQTSQAWCDIAEDWRKTNQELKLIQEREQNLRNVLISLSHGKSSVGGGVKLSKRIRKGSVDYSKIKELENVDLECYRKPNTEYWALGES